MTNDSNTLSEQEKAELDTVFEILQLLESKGVTIARASLILAWAKQKLVQSPLGRIDRADEADNTEP